MSRTIGGARFELLGLGGTTLRVFAPPDVRGRFAELAIQLFTRIGADNNVQSQEDMDSLPSKLALSEEAEALLNRAIRVKEAWQVNHMRKMQR